MLGIKRQEFSEKKIELAKLQTYELRRNFYCRLFEASKNLERLKTTS